MQRTTLLGGMTKIKDYDLTSLAVALTGGGVYEGLVMSNVSGTNWKVTKGKGLVLCTTTGGTKKIAHYELDTDYTFTLSGNFKCRIQVGQTNIDDPLTNSVDGSGIGAITTGASYPASNYIPLGSVTSGVLTLETQAFTVLVSRLNLALYGGDVSADNVGASDVTSSTLTVSGSASMPSGTLFGGNTIADLVTSYILANKTITAGENITAGQAIYLSGEKAYNWLERIGGTALGATTDRIGDTTTNWGAGQSFTTDAAGLRLSAVTVYLDKNNSPTGNLTMKIWSNTSGTLVATSTNTISATSVTSSPLPYTFNFNNAQLAASTVYYISIESNSVVLNNRCRWKSVAGVYAGGQSYGLTSAGVRTAVPGGDKDFIIYGKSPLPSGQVGVANATYKQTSNFIGFAMTTATALNPIEINTVGINNNQSGLTIGVDHYLSNTPGAISATAGTYSVRVGLSISATELQIGEIINTIA